VDQKLGNDFDGPLETSSRGQLDIGVALSCGYGKQTAEGHCGLLEGNAAPYCKLLQKVEFLCRGHILFNAHATLNHLDDGE
jgi:hypothetical protein